MLRLFVDGGIDTADAAQRQALDGLPLCGMVRGGELVDTLADDVLYSLRMVREPAPPTDNNPALSLTEPRVTH